MPCLYIRNVSVTVPTCTRVLLQNLIHSPSSLPSPEHCSPPWFSNLGQDSPALIAKSEGYLPNPEMSRTERSVGRGWGMQSTMHRGSDPPEATRPLGCRWTDGQMSTVRWEEGSPSTSLLPFVNQAVLLLTALGRQARSWQIRISWKTPAPAVILWTKWYKPDQWIIQKTGTLFKEGTG